MPFDILLKNRPSKLMVKGEKYSRISLNYDIFFISRLNKMNVA